VVATGFACSTSKNEDVTPATSKSGEATTKVAYDRVYDLVHEGTLTLPDGNGEACAADELAGIRVTADCLDPELAVPFIDEDEAREVEDPKTGEVLAYRRIGGGFEDSPVRFALHFPVAYRGRFFQSTYPTVGSEQVPDDRIAGGLRNGAAVVASNNAGGVSASPSLGGVRANAATAKVARHLVPQLYGKDAPARGYIYGASGGAYQTIGALESTTGVWDGGVPIVPGTPNAIPSFMTVQLLGLHALADDLPSIVDAVEPGGGGDPFAGLDPDERAVLEEVTRLGFPIGGWWQHESLTGGAFGIVQQAVRGIDPGYADDFWSVPGYEGADPSSSIHDARIAHETTIDAINGQTVTVADVPPADVFGADVIGLSGEAQGREVSITEAEGRQLVVEGDLSGLAPGDRVRIDNSWFLAMHYYHRHQVPDADQYGWDALRHADGAPIHPQRPSLIGPVVTDVFGSQQSGDYAGRMIVLSSINDVEAFPWAADWYARRVADALGDGADDRFRLWYLENADHIARPDRTHAIDYSGAVEQALMDLDAWVAADVAPPPNTTYEIGERSEVLVPDDAADRRGIQPVVHASAGGSGCDDTDGARVDVDAGEEVAISVSTATPPGGGSIIDVEWDFDGSGGFAGKGEDVEIGPTATTCSTHRYDEPGTYFATVRVTSHRNGDPDAVDGRITNLARVRVVVS
jgi:hypothetical protein